jgi:hypothetical protein
MMACLPFKKPKEKFGPLRYDASYSNISVYSKTKNEVTDMIWVLLRSLTRPMVEVPVKANVMEQAVPHIVVHTVAISAGFASMIGG